LIASLASLNAFTGVTPARLFQIATKRSSGQFPANSTSSLSLVMVSNGVVAAALASSGVENTLMLFSGSIVNVFM
jgi:hypothetical protein